MLLLMADQGRKTWHAAIGNRVIEAEASTLMFALFKHYHLSCLHVLVIWSCYMRIRYNRGEGRAVFRRSPICRIVASASGSPPTAVTSA